MTAQSIFIVEDEIITARSIAENIKLLGYKVAGIATTSSKAISQILKTRPDLVLMDILLKNSEHDGIDAAKIIHQQSDVPIVYLTAHSDETTLERAKITTPFGYILKPYTKKDLQISLKMALYKHNREREVVRREKLYSNILRSTKDGIIATDDSECLTYINPAAQKMTGWEASEALQQKASAIVRIFDDRTQEFIPNPIRQVLNEGRVVYLDGNAMLIAKDGSQVSIQDSVSPIVRQQDNAVTGAVLVFALQRSNSEDSLSSIARQTSAVSERLNELSLDLLEVVVHELRIPLTIILSTSESLRLYGRRWTVQKQNSSFNRIQRAVKRMTRLLDNVSIWKQADTKKLQFKPESIDVVTLCEELLSDIQAIDADNYQLVLTYDINNREAFLDPILLNYPLNNLLFNAIKYSPENSTIYLTIEEQPNYLIFRVRDEGIGIPKSEHSRLFDPFYRGRNVENIAGMGLGLAIAKACVEIHRGTISLESEVGVGTSFTITLPLN